MEMEEKVLTLRNKWSAFQKIEIDRTKKELTFKYGPLGHEKTIQAILFWQFIRKHLTTEELRKNGLAVTIQEFWKLRRLFLSGFVANRNTFMTIIAMIESFSTNLWRKILWKCNIDFVSFESFLRRLEEKHVRAIAESYISIEKDIDFDKPFDEEKRYLSKSSWSYNLLGLDFGFNAYPKGEADDIKLVEVNPLRFLSEKDHSDDFVVQQEEGGKYWWLYKKARSNYVWCPNRDVQLKTHICPGFWYTMLVHFIFWFGSPAACLFFIAMLSSGNFHKALLAIIPVAAITPLWLLVAGMKALVDSVFLERTWDRFANVASWVLLTGVCVGGASVFVWLAISFYRFLIENHIDILMTLILLSVPVAFVAYCIYYKNKYDSGEKVNNVLEFCFKTYTTAACAFVFFRAIQLYHGFFWKIITVLAYFIAAVSMKIWAFLADFWNITGPLFLGIVIAPLAISLVFIYTENRLSREKQEKLSKLLEKISQMLCLTAISFVCFLVVFVFWSSRGMDRTDLMVVATILVMSGVMFFLSWFAYSHNPTYVEYTSFQFSRAKMPIKLLMRNKWLCSLSAETRYERIKTLQEFFTALLLYSDRSSRYSFLLPFIDERSFSILEFVLLSRPLMSRLRAFTFPERLLKKIILEGMSFVEAEQKLFLELAAEQEVIEKIKKAFRKFFFPLIFAGEKIYFVVSKIVEYGKTLYRLYELFNKRCPYVAKSKPLTGN